MAMMARMGRPPKLKAQRKTRQVNIRLTAAEFRELSAKARAAGLPLGTYIMAPHRKEVNRG